MVAHRPVIVLAGVLATLAVSGCGGQQNNAPGGINIMAPEQQNPGAGGRQLSASDSASVLGSYRTIARACSGDAQARTQVPVAVRSLDQEITRYPNKTWETGSPERAVVLYAFAGEMSTYLRQCGLPGSDVLARRAKLARAAAEDA